jgi:hypothetical protein
MQHRHSDSKLGAESPPDSQRQIVGRAARCLRYHVDDGAGLQSQVKPIGYTWSYLACRIGRLVLIWQPLIGTPFHLNDVFSFFLGGGGATPFRLLRASS